MPDDTDTDAEILDPLIRSVALACATVTASHSMMEIDPLEYVDRFEDYIRHGRQSEEPDSDPDL